MAWPSAEEALAWLQSQDLAPADAGVLLRAAGGRPEDALRWAQAGLTARQWSELPKAMARGELAALTDWSPAQAVDALQKVCHDLLALAAGGAPRFFAPADLPGPVAPGGLQALAAWWRELADAMRTVDHPFNSGLMMEALVSQARAALHCARPLTPRRP
jgi:DNA polymerase-3 subunit delta'